jgi:hypothetical protein
MGERMKNFKEMDEVERKARKLLEERGEIPSRSGEIGMPGKYRSSTCQA